MLNPYEQVIRIENPIWLNRVRFALSALVEEVDPTVAVNGDARRASRNVIFYSMFGFQRTGDNFWAFGDARGRGFLMGGTAGRTTLNGEGLQHQDGHSLLLFSSIPNILTYDPAFAYEVTAIIREGLRRMYEAQEDIFYYVTLYNENIAHPPMPQGVEEGILRGLYRFRQAEAGARPAVHLFGSGIILQAVLKGAADALGAVRDRRRRVERASYQQLRNQAPSADRWNRLHPETEPRRPYVESVLEGVEGPIVAASDFVKAIPDMIRPWVRKEQSGFPSNGAALVLVEIF